jgi:hypothetical protein
MQIIKRMAALLLSLGLAACGGGGGDAGAPPFGDGATGGGGSTGGGTTTPSGGISEVSTGVPSQRFMSISVGTYNLDWSFDGTRTKVQVYIADTAGNPVPDGTPIQFSTEGGQIVTSCTTTGVQNGSSVISGCEVEFNTQDFRPTDGFVRIIAWMEGEEAYKDLNANGKYDTGEPFVDTGQIFRDDDDSGDYSATFDELVVDATLTGTPGIGSAACLAPTQPVNINEVPLSVLDSCDGVWGKTLIRRTVVMPVSDPRALGLEAVAGGVRVFSEYNLGVRTAAPAGTTVSVINPPAGCTITVSPSVVPPTAVLPSFHALITQATAASAPNACVGNVTVEAKWTAGESARVVYTLP